MPLRYFRREYEADLSCFAGMIYEEFDPDVHVPGPKNRLGLSRLPEIFAEVRAGVDWGFRNPGAIVVVGRDYDGVWWALDEHVRDKVPVAAGCEPSWVHIAAQLRERYGIARFACDPSGPAYISSLRRAGLPAYAADNDVGAGIQTVATALHCDAQTGRPGLLIAPDCKHLLDEMSAYAWDDQSEGERPQKENDHAVDALRYALHTRKHAPAWW